MNAIPAGSGDYVHRLGLPARPRIEDMVGRRVVGGQPINLFQLMIATLIERGGPISLGDVALRLKEAGARSPIGDMLLSLKKAWRRREPIYERPDGLLALNVNDPNLDLTIFVIGLRPARGIQQEAPPPPAVPDPSVPLTLDEVRAAFTRCSVRYFSYNRLVAAILDAHGRAMSPAEIMSFLAAIEADARDLPLARFQAGLADLVAVTPEDLLGLDVSAPGVPAMRVVVRKRAAPTLRYEAMSRHHKIVGDNATARHRERERDEAAAAARLRRCIVRVVPDEGPIAAVAVLDLASRQISSFAAAEIDNARAAVAGYELIAAVKPREVLHRLGLEVDQLRSVDLGPPRRELRRDAGRPLRLTPDLVIASTTGIEDPLGKPAQVASDIAHGRAERLRARVESDVRSLLAHYRYVQLHGNVLVRWRREVEEILVEWPIQGDASLRVLLLDAARTGAQIDLVVGAAPDWDDPWRRAFGVFVTRMDRFDFAFAARDGRAPQAFRLDDVMEARLVAGHQAADADGTPRASSRHDRV